MAIHHWSTEKQPRQKLVQQGADRLTDAELLAIFLRTGVRGKTAVQLSEQLLEEFGSLTALLVADYQSFTTVKGLGIAKYAQLQAMLELAKRYMYESVVESSVLEFSGCGEDIPAPALKKRALRKIYFAAFRQSTQGD